ncbi:hypothetical protein BSZ05_13720 [Vibrio mediterranei]|uniref:Uncharacterized protein n=1 Tax=Vibrio mediterranei TaxID=689 RepID=A0AAN1FHK5_9VIBR|nr:hypothetical protein BSZ05_13720 [Vibrio mediterranei]
MAVCNRKVYFSFLYNFPSLYICKIEIGPYKTKKAPQIEGQAVRASQGNVLNIRNRIFFSAFLQNF